MKVPESSSALLISSGRIYCIDSLSGNGIGGLDNDTGRRWRAESLDRSRTCWRGLAETLAAGWRRSVTEPRSRRKVVCSSGVMARFSASAFSPNSRAVANCGRISATRSCRRSSRSMDEWRHRHRARLAALGGVDAAAAPVSGSTAHRMSRWQPLLMSLRRSSITSPQRRPPQAEISTSGRSRCGVMASPNPCSIAPMGRHPSTMTARWQRSPRLWRHWRWLRRSIGARRSTAPQKSHRQVRRRVRYCLAPCLTVAWRILTARSVRIRALIPAWSPRSFRSALTVPCRCRR